ncbi:F-box protein 42 isoform X2 [Dermatophagoides farinae]|uniref:F-box protein 42 isoform X2 n=1 Tax=Dermatophagoides farinae TaxID=6954 RepID=UPI003F61A92F
MGGNSSGESCSIIIDSKKSKSQTTIENLPTLAIEFILSQLTYYQLLQIRLVSRHWYSLIQEYLSRADRNFFINLTNYRVQWVAVKEQVKYCNQHQSQKSTAANAEFKYELNLNSSKKLRTIPRMSPRLHHLACYVDNYMYVYGGCVSLTTTYNDLWRFDTTSKHWSRIVAEGTLPLPRLFGSLSLYNCHENNGNGVQIRKQYLVLFGGIVFNDKLQPPTFDDRDRLLKTIHLFDIQSNRWTLIQINGSIELKSCHHTATIVGDELIIACNGHSFVNERPIDGSDAAASLFVFDLRKHCWRCQRTVGPMPTALLFNSARVIPPMATPAMILQSAKELFCSRTRAIPNSFIMDDHHILYISHVSNYSQQASPSASLLKRTGRCQQWPNCLECRQMADDANDADDDNDNNGSSGHHNNNDNNQTPWQWQPIDLSNVEPDLKCGNICIINNRLLAYLSVKNRYFYESKSTKHAMFSQPPAPPIISQPANAMNNNTLITTSTSNPVHPVDKRSILHEHITEVISHRRIRKLRPIRSMDYTVAPNAFNYYSLVATPESLILFGGYFVDEMYKDIQNRLFLLVSKPETSID